MQVNQQISPSTGRGIYLCPKCRKPLQRREDGLPIHWECSTAPACTYTQADNFGRPAPPAGLCNTGGAAAHRPAVRPMMARLPGQVRPGELCPVCGTGLLVSKSIKGSGKAFIGCHRFPQCRFFRWRQDARD
jgi:DNA topoisomerase III